MMSLDNIIENNKGALLFLVPGSVETFRVHDCCTVSFWQACMNRPGRFATLAVPVMEHRDACEQRWRVAE
jgi:hypothetical protein